MRGQGLSVSRNASLEYVVLLNVKLNLYRRWRAKRAEQEALAKEEYRWNHGGSGFKMMRVKFQPLRIGTHTVNYPTIRKEDLLYLRINYVNNTLTTSIETKTP